MSVKTPAGGRRQPTIHEVAASAGVSIGTVSRVAGESPRVAPETRARVLAAMAELGYQPNAAARAMRTNQTKTIGFLIPDMTNQVFARVAQGAETVLAPEGYMLFAFSSNRSPAREVAFLQAARQRQMDGLIVTLSDETATATIEEIGRMGVPVVVLDREVPVEADVVYSEHMQSIETVVGQLLELGHRRIGLVTASQNIRPGRDRVAGFRRALERAGLPVDDWLIRANRQSAEYGAAETHDLLTGANPPTAILAAGSDIFYGALRAVRLLGLTIPDDISFVGADDPLLGDLVYPPITVIDRDMVEVGRQAAGLLLDRLRGLDMPPRRIMLGSNVLLRRSIAAPRHR
ncbi:LacI family DNA-binding transcriptional regulator [Kaistia dalseonensis]|uniref:LacI family transcriptional regulator n=1 Tax=Kaistia dalseonensis TaxID=410840 RepID=A0ABU0HA88_9HYPH|nr:LacI family DNA-binding transcriptional regulator [Kaistia dalseonensis]MCX5496608.1 LacI family DNA-binding transcriptional regulator [Kaistia dalseonensis]MDQ0439231.1 LacI family transcriptional regulator [Kaistia dalseonensis]